MGTFGYSTPTTDFGDSNNSGCMTCTRFTLPESASDLTALHLYGRATTAGYTQNFRTAVYANNAGALGALKGVSSQVAIDYNSGTPKFWDFPISTGALAAADYWFTVLYGATNLYSYIYTDIHAGNGVYYIDPFWAYSAAGAPPDPGGALTLGAASQQIAIYATYTAGIAIPSLVAAQVGSDIVCTVTP